METLVGKPPLRTRRRVLLRSDNAEYTGFASLFALIALIALVVIGVIERNIVQTLVFGVAFGAIGVTVVALEIRTGPLSKTWLSAFMLVYAARTIVVVMLHFGLNFTEHGPWWNFGDEGGDELGFWLHSEPALQAWQQGGMDAWTAGELLHVFRNYIGWLHLVGFIRFIGEMLGGSSTLHVKLFLCMAGALCVPYTYGLARSVLDEKRAKVAALLAFALPDYWFFSATIMRDIFVCAANIALFYHVFLLLHRRFSWLRTLLIILLNFYLVRFLRADLALINTGIIIITAAWVIAPKLQSPAVRIVLILCTISAVVVSVLNVNVVSSTMDSFTSGRYTEASAVEERILSVKNQALEDAGSGSFGANILRTSIWIRWPSVSALFLLQPIPPWSAMHDITKGYMLKAILLTVCATGWYAFLIYLPSGFGSCLKHRTAGVSSLLIAASLYIVLFGLAVGVTPRWRLSVMPLLLTMIAVGVYERRIHRNAVILTVAVMAMGLVAYYVLKYL